MNSKLATLDIYSPCNYGKRTHAIDTITIHCMAAPWSAKTCATYFSNKDTKAASNYCIGKDGEIAVSVPEDMAAWCSSNKGNDMRSVTIEVSSDTKHPYTVTDAALKSLIALCADICKRNGIKALVWSNSKADRINHANGANMTVHRDYANKACPGDYLMNKMPYIASETNKLLKPTKPQEDTMVRYKTIEEMPSFYQAEAKELVELGFKGKGGTAGLDVTEDMLRTMIVNLRMCKALIAAVPNVDKAALFKEFKDNLNLSISVEVI